MNGPHGPAMPAWWTPWAKLGLFGKVKRGAAIAFTVFHVGAMFTMGASANVKKVFTPVFGFYDSRLKMTNTWGMFSKRPSSTHVRIEALDADGAVTLVASTHSTGKSFFERFADGRIRKIQSKLGDTKDRNSFGNDYLDGWCRFRAKQIPQVREIRAVQELHEMRDDRNRVTRKAVERVVLRRTCTKTGKPRSLTVTDENLESADGDDN